MEIISLVLNVLFGGALVTVFTLRSVRAKASEDVKGVKIDNEEKQLKLMTEYIVEPLKKEIDELRKETQQLRKDTQQLRKEVRYLQKAIAKISDCSYADSCPVRRELQSRDDDRNGA
jgi:predicted RNase H-like nuclease (RuvC/YqgF family)